MSDSEPPHPGYRPRPPTYPESVQGYYGWMVPHERYVAYRKAYARYEAELDYWWRRMQEWRAWSGKRSDETKP